MTSDQPDELSLSTRLALDRTRVAYDRTMLAWIRTAASLITFGFSVYKLFQVIPRNGDEPVRFITSHTFGTILVCIGLISLLVATVEYRQNMKTLGPTYRARQWPLSVLVAMLIGVLGILALITMLLRQ